MITIIFSIIIVETAEASSPASARGGASKLLCSITASADNFDSWYFPIENRAYAYPPKSGVE